MLPNEELRPGVMGFGVLVYRTDLDGEVVISVRPEGLVVETGRGG